jgi:flavin reductase (DIM6/NTAB) family NADH-FMN oxidoreductase RutF
MAVEKIHFIPKDTHSPMKSYPLDKIYRLIEPSPVVLVTTRDRKGNANVMTASWIVMMDFTPPLIGLSLGPWNHSYTTLRRARECVIGIPGVDLISRVVGIGNCSGSDTDKFAAFKFTPAPAEKVRAPLLAECLHNLECRLVDSRMVGKYNFWVLEAIAAWENPTRKERRIFHAHGNGLFHVQGRTINLQKEMTRWQEFVD